MINNQRANATEFDVEKGYPECIQLDQMHTDWDVSLPDSIQYGSPVTNLSPQRGTVVEKLRRKGLDVSTEQDVIDCARMGRRDIIKGLWEEWHLWDEKDV